MATNHPIWTLSIELCDDVSPLAQEPWKGLIEISAQATLEDLHIAIQDAVEFENDHLYEFYIANSPTHHDGEVFSAEEGNIFDTQISEIFPLDETEKFFYWFDFGDDWMFEISHVEESAHAPIAGERYPRLVSESGEKPIQYPSYDEYDEDEDDDDDHD